MASRWANEEADKAEELRRKKEKEDKKRLKLQKQHEAEESAQVMQVTDSRPAKRRRLSTVDDGRPSPRENALYWKAEPGLHVITHPTSKH